MRFLILLLFLFTGFDFFAQSVGINTGSPHASAALEVSSASQGLLTPRMGTTLRKSISAPADGLLVYDTDTKSLWIFSNNNWVEIMQENIQLGLKSNNGSSTFTPFFISPQRYIFEINGSTLNGTSIPIPQNIIDSYCGDDDGCKVTLTMSNWQSPIVESAMVSFNFSYHIPTRRWRATLSSTDPSQFREGIDNNGSVEHVYILFNNIFFTDGAYTNLVSNDAGSGFSLLKWTTFSTNTIGRLILED